MHSLFAATSIGIADLKKNPSAAIREAGENTVVILHHNMPSAYLVPAKTYEAMMEVFDDLQLVPLVRARLAELHEHPDEIVETSIAQLERSAMARLPAAALPAPPASTATKTTAGKSGRRR